MPGGAVLAIGWFGAVLLLGLLALPLAERAFGDQVRGAAFAVPLGLAWLTMGTFWLGRISLPYAPPAAIAVLAVLAAVSFRRSDAEIDPRACAEAALVFATGFGLVLLLRSVNPAITASGETYWNFALVQSLLRTARLPAMDPWFAGEAVRYYFGGHLLVAALADLLVTPGRYALGLGQAAFFGALLTASFGVAAAIAGSRDRPRRPAGLLGAFVVGFASNLHTPVWAVLAVLPAPIADPLDAAVPIDGAGPSLEASFTLVDASHFAFTNTDFPAYSVFFTGVHPHVMSPPFLLLLVGVAVAYYVSPAEDRRRRLALLGLTTPLVGLVAVVNTWSLPTACGLVAMAVALAPAHPLTLVRDADRIAGASPGRAWLARIGAGVLVGLAAGAAGLAWVAPYVLRGLAGDPSLGLLPARSGPWFFVIGYGGFLLVFGASLAADLGDLDWSGRRLTAALVLGAVLVAVGWLGDFPGLVLVGPLLLGGLALRRRDPSDFVAVLLTAGAGLVLLVELAYVAEAAEPGRYNTVYKVYMQTWVLWGPAAGVALAHLFDPGPASRQGRSWGPAFVVVVVAALSIYGLAGIGGNVAYAVEEGVSPSLDGLGYLDDDRPAYAAALDWLADRPGQPTIVSAPATERRLYQFNASPAASLTGIPTLVGWNHEADYRGTDAYRARVRAVDAVYAGTRGERARTLRAYDVAFVWVGEAEEARYRTIDYSREPGISTAFHRGNVTIYRVDGSALAAS